MIRGEGQRLAAEAALSLAFPGRDQEAAGAVAQAVEAADPADPLVRAPMTTNERARTCTSWPRSRVAAISAAIHCRLSPGRLPRSLMSCGDSTVSATTRHRDSPGLAVK